MEYDIGAYNGSQSGRMFFRRKRHKGNAVYSHTGNRRDSSDRGFRGSQEAEYVLNLGDVLAEDHPHSQSYYWFADRVKELTK